ncbi:response regulator [Ruminococcaceae bacterium OttesenSCG-928-L11]|nr:response regulator [Ruminococcaceae bacterium OttesenSCG-928-L11]
MKTLLIVEDETRIREGIRAIVSRSPVPVEEILESKNGEQALEILRSQPVDALITDIRMPGMDGLELVRLAQKLETPPLTVVISGYDEFTYAVEMFREGIRDYLVKPLDRDKLVAVLARLDAELSARQRTRETRLEAGRPLLRLLLLGQAPLKSELAAIADQFPDLLPPGSYRIACIPTAAGTVFPQEGELFIPDMDGNHALLSPGDDPDAIFRRFPQQCIGLSQVHDGVSALRCAYVEALDARGYAYLTGKSTAFSPHCPTSPPPSMEAELRQIVHLVGAFHSQSARHALGQIVLLAQNGQLSPTAFADGMALLSALLRRAYGPVLGEEQNWMGTVWAYRSVFEYYVEACGWLDELCRQLCSHHESDNQRKITKAVQYLDEHYLDNMDMATVSNYVSMNYTQFSQLFKQHTGCNFLEYVKLLRLEESKRLLRDDSLRIADVSVKSGFKNEKHFMKVFKQTYGVSPSEYRRNARMGADALP